MKDSLKESLKAVINNILVTEDLSNPSNFTCFFIDDHFNSTDNHFVVQEWIEDVQHSFVCSLGITDPEMLEQSMVVHSAVLHKLGKGYVYEVYYGDTSEERDEVLEQTELFRECRTAWLNFLLADLEA